MRDVSLSFTDDDDLGLIQLALHNLIQDHGEMSAEEGDEWDQDADRAAKLLERVVQARLRLERKNR